MIIRQLPFFLVAAEEENFLRAASRLNLTHSALSRRINDLEVELGFKLFERHPSGISLNATGKLFRDDIKRILTDLDNARIRATRFDQRLQGTLTISFHENVLRYKAVPRAFRTFRTSYPDVELKLVPMSSAQQLGALRAGKVDAALLHQTREENPDFASYEIPTDDKLVLVMSTDHPLADRRQLTMDDIKGEEFILPSPVASPPVIYERILWCFQSLGVTPRVAMEALSSDATFNAVVSGLGIGFVPISQKGREPPGTVLKEMSDFYVPLHLDLAWLKTDTKPILEKFIDIVRDV